MDLIYKILNFAILLSLSSLAVWVFAISAEFICKRLKKNKKK